MRIYSNAEVEAMVRQEREDMKSGALIGMCAAAISGAVSMLLIMLAINAWWPK